MSRLTVWGARYSVYSRILALALIEKDVEHDWIETDVFGDADAQAKQRDRHPWAKIPAMADEGLVIYETAACLAWLDQERFGPPWLVPHDPLARTRATQIVSIVDAYAYPAMVWQVFVQLVREPARGGEADSEKVSAGLSASDAALGALEDIASDGPFLAGPDPSLADLYLAPVLAKFAATDPGHEALYRRPRLARWWRSWCTRPSMIVTRWQGDAG